MHHLKAHASGAQVGSEGRIQEAIDTTVYEDGIIDVAPGAYSETATHRDPPGLSAASERQFGRSSRTPSPASPSSGVTDADVPVSLTPMGTGRHHHPRHQQLRAVRDFVAGDDTTVQGLEIGANAADSGTRPSRSSPTASHSCDSFLNDDAGAIYFGDLDRASVTSRIATYHVDGNRFAADNGSPSPMGPATGIRGTARQPDHHAATCSTALRLGGASASAVRAARRGIVYPVGGATISGNDFGPADINIRATGIYDESEFHWTDWRNDNTFARLVWVGSGPRMS